jgi:16S rRNA (cytidine1402-2'-O)-methyltransferase
MPELHLIPNLIGPASAQQHLPQATLEALRRQELFFVEHPKSLRRLLKSAGVPPPYDHLRMEILDKRPGDHRYGAWWSLLESYGSAALVSDSGLPAVADPGEEWVAYLRRQGARIVPHVGPSALFLALMASGLNGERFSFHGYPPVEARRRRETLRQWERRSREEGSTQICIEAPQRNQALLGHILEVLAPDTRLCVAWALHHTEEEAVRTDTIRRWREQPWSLGKRPALFLFQA